MPLDGSPRINTISSEIVDAALAVHSALRPGLLEGVYEACLKHELATRGFDVLSQVALPIRYRGVELDVGYRIDLIVNQKVIVEVKAIEALRPVHRAQVLSYLKLSGRTVGLLINFNVTRLRDGIERLVNRA